MIKLATISQRPDWIKCGTCVHWHRQSGQRHGYCLRPLPTETIVEAIVSGDSHGLCSEWQGLVHIQNGDGSDQISAVDYLQATMLDYQNACRATDGHGEQVGCYSVTKISDSEIDATPEG